MNLLGPSLNAPQRKRPIALRDGRVWALKALYLPRRLERRPRVDHVLLMGVCMFEPAHCMRQINPAKDRAPLSVRSTWKKKMPDASAGQQENPPAGSRAVSVQTTYGPVLFQCDSKTEQDGVRMLETLHPQPAGLGSG